ncbi:hypothetical protein C8R44DRAFT_764119 [Mycena epipterygia]|nr:hypothetical protein C8R44DRAFT_764119 [Mycena epipterygia]
MATVDNTFGLMYDVVVISAALYGAAIVQGWFYYRTYFHRDPMMIKLLVFAVLLCDTCQQALLAESIYIYLVKGHLDPLIFDRIVPTFLIEVFFNALIALMVQQFYAYRIYRLSKNNWILGGFVSLLSIGAFASLITLTVEGLTLEHISDLLTLKDITLARNILGAGTDILISGIMVFLLHFQKSGNRKTTDMLNRLIIFTFNNGLPTTFCALACAVAITAWPDTMIYIFWFLLLGRLYTTSLLVTLNSREYIRSTVNSEVLRLQSGLHFQTGTDIISPPRAFIPQNDTHITIRIDKHSESDLQTGREYLSADSRKATPGI